MTPPRISAVLGSYNRARFLKRTIRSLRRELSDMDHEIIVVDGGSTDGAIRWLARQKDIITIIQHNRGEWRGQPVHRRSWGYFMNLAFRAAKGQHILMVSDDCLLVPGSVNAGILRHDALTREGRKVGALAFYWRDTFRRSEYIVGHSFGNKLFVNHGMFLREALEDIGFCDEEAFHFYHADSDMCMRLWANGWEIADVPDAFVEHFPHVSKDIRQGNLAQERKDWAEFVTRWQERFSTPEANKTGARIRMHTDHYRTYLDFPPQDIAMVAIKRIRSRLRRTFAKDNGNA